MVLARGNAGKLREFEEILNPLGYTVVFQKDVVGPLEVEEDVYKRQFQRHPPGCGLCAQRYDWGN